MIRLGVNVDHVATVRQARGGTEPDPVTAAHEAELGGAATVYIYFCIKPYAQAGAEQLSTFVKTIDGVITSEGSWSLA